MARSGRTTLRARAPATRRRRRRGGRCARRRGPGSAVDASLERARRACRTRRPGGSARGRATTRSATNPSEQAERPGSRQRHQQGREGQQLDRGAEDVAGDAAEAAYARGVPARRRRATASADRQRPAPPRSKPAQSTTRRPRAPPPPSHATTAANGATVPACGRPSPSARAAGTRAQQVIERATREAQTSTPAPARHRARATNSDASAAAWTPSTTTVATTPAGPGRAGLHHGERALAVVGRGEPVGDVGEAVPVQRPAAGGERADGDERRPRAGCSSSQRPTQPITPTSTPERQHRERREQHRPAGGARRRPRAGGATGIAVSVPTREPPGVTASGSRSASSATSRSSATGAAHDRHGGDRAAALAEPHAEVEDRLEAELVERQRLGRLGGAVAGGEPGGRARREPVGRQRARHRDQAVEQDRDAGARPRPGSRSPRPGRRCRARSGVSTGSSRRGRRRGRAPARRRSILWASAGVVDAGAAAGDLGGGQPERGGDQRRRRGGVADAHVAAEQQLRAGGDLLGGDGRAGGERLLRSRRR